MPETLMIVDDDEGILRSLRRLFRKHPFRVVTESSPIRALERLHAEPVSVILSDQRMPDMSGSEMLEQAKLIRPDTIRMVMSGYTELETITRAINAGAVFRFLTKPWEDAELLNHVDEAFEIYRLKRENHRLNEALKEANRALGEEVKVLTRSSHLTSRTAGLCQTILDEIPAFTLGLDTSGEVVLANRRARDFLGRPALIGQHFSTALPEPLANALSSILSGAHVNECARLENSSGEEIVIQTTRFQAESGGEGILLHCP